MKLIIPIFIILTIVFFFFGITTFVAGTFIFLATQAFYDIYFYSGIWTAYITIFLGTILFSYLIFIGIYSANKYIVKKKIEAVKARAISLSLPNKIFIVLILMQILKLLYLKKNKE
jgi:hypothetical protein